jgi:tetratricopeptide (TPR) repeat protein
MIAHGRELYEQLADPGAAGDNYLAEVNSFEFAKGQLERAVVARRDLLQKATESGSDFDLAGHGFFLGLILVELANYDEASVALNETIIHADKARWLQVFPRSLLAIVYARQGLVERAREVLEQAEAILSMRPRAWAELNLRWSQANVLAAEGRWDEAFRTFEDAAAKLSEGGFRPTHAAAMRDWAEAHLARGEPADAQRARELFGLALSEYKEMGATGYVERVQARLAELGD